MASAASSTSSYPEPYIIPPSTTHTTTLILLHGTSTSGPELASALLSICIPIPISISITPSPPLPETQIQTQTLTSLLPGTKFIFPTGRLRPTTVFGGRESHAWFDVHSFGDRTAGEDGLGVRAGVRESAGYLGGLVEREMELLNHRNEKEGACGSGSGSGGRSRSGDGEVGKRVIVGGFSQGAAMVSMLILGGFVPGVMGFVGLSGWLPWRGALKRAVVECKLGRDDGVREVYGKRRGAVRGCLRDILGLGDCNREGDDGGKGDEEDGLGDMRFWVAHGMADEKVRLEWGEQMEEVIKSVGVVVNMHTYEGLGHELEGGEIGEMVSFLKGRWVRFLT